MLFRSRAALGEALRQASIRFLVVDRTRASQALQAFVDTRLPVTLVERDGTRVELGANGIVWERALHWLPTFTCTVISLPLRTTTTGTVLPGLVEAHFHPTYFNVAALEDLDIKYPIEYITILAAANARLALECGYTSARSGGSLHNIDVWLKKAIDEGITNGPRLAASGREICGIGGLMDWNPDFRKIGMDGLAGPLDPDGWLPLDVYNRLTSLLPTLTGYPWASPHWMARFVFGA